MWEGGLWNTASTTSGTAGVGHDWKRTDGYVVSEWISIVLKARVWSASISTWSANTSASTNTWTACKH